MDYIYYALGWGIYYAIHSILASQQCKNILQKKLISPRWYRLFYNATAILLFINMIVWHGQLPKEMAFNSFWFSIGFGILTLLAGSYIMLLALRQYNLAEFSGTAYLKGKVEAGTLNTSGLNAYIRHPIYLATFLLVWGLWITFPYWSLLVPVLVTTLYIPIGISFEEQKLITIFGKEYVDYKSKVPMVFPDKL